MKGATIGHSKQRIRDGRYIGMTEPGIIAAEPPNPIVNQLVIMPDIEKRLEAFVRCAHAIVVFPGGAGTAEEILYLLGILLDPANEDQPLPIVFTGPPSAAEYFGQIDQFIGATLGPKAQKRYKIVIADPAQAAREIATRRGSRARPSPHEERRLQLQLAAENPARLPAALRTDARSDGEARAAARPGCRTSWRRICGARSPESSPAMSRSRASARSRRSVRSSCTATRTLMNAAG